MGKLLKLTMSSGTSFDVTHVRLFPQRLIADAEAAAEGLSGALGKNSWFLGSPVGLVLAKAVVDKAYKKKDQQTLALVQQCRALAEKAGQWFEITEAEINFDEGLDSIVAWGSFTATKPEELNLSNWYARTPLRRSYQEGAFFVLYPGRDFIQVRDQGSDHAVRISSIESFTFDGD